MLIGQGREISTAANNHLPDTLEWANHSAPPEGRVAEWLKAPDSKSGVRVTVPWVQIPPLPPFFPLTRAFPCFFSLTVPDSVTRTEELVLKLVLNFCASLRQT